jgi:hypothetical protein
MFLLYVDESGDSGLINSPVSYFILSGLVIHELRWNSVLNELIDFRKYLRSNKGLKLREEIHASDFINNPGDLKRIKRNDRADILKKCAHWIASQTDLNIINIVVDKRGRTDDIFEIAWRALIQRFENTLNHRNFPGPQNPDERGLIIPDNTDNKKLQQLLRKMRRFNLVPNSTSTYAGGQRNLALRYIVEDPFFKNSADSLFHQMVDVAAYSVRQLYEPNKYIKKKGLKNMAYILDPVLCKYASRTNAHGIVEI